MCRKLIYLISVMVLALFLTSSAYAANIILVTQTKDADEDGIQDDQGFIDLLMAEGHCVNVQPDNWTEIADPNTPEKLAELNAADLVIVSRSNSSGAYDEEGEPNMWNSVTSPMILMSAYIPRSSKWLWMDTTSVVQADDILMATDASHPVFDGVELIDGTMVLAYDNTVSGGLTTFVGTLEVGNGTLIAQALSGDNAAIVEWEAGVEMYPGGAIAGGPRMFFAAGSHEKDATDMVVGPQGGYNLLADGRQMFLNAISYMVSAGQ